MMQLLTFAHRGEAQHFLKEGDYEALPFAFDGVYRNSKSLLLITGEGLQNASEKTAALCGAFNQEIREIINLGVAGALGPEVELGEIYSVRTAYAENQFKSYSSKNSQTKIDCISSTQRVFDEEQAKHLNCFAPLVDRELWSVGAIASLFKLPFHAIKLVSDRVGDNLEICQVVKEQAPEYSARLYQYYLENFSGEISQISSEFIAENDKRLYFTTSQSRKYRALLTSLEQKLQLKEDQLLAQLNIEKLCQDYARPKQRSNVLLTKMHLLLNPFQGQVKNKLDGLLEDYQANGIHIKFDENFENDDFSLSARVQGPEHLKKVLSQLESFPYAKIQKLFRGDLNV